MNGVGSSSHAGEGPHLKAFSREGEVLCTSEALPFSVVHGLKPFPHGELRAFLGLVSVRCFADTTSCLLLVFGRKTFKVLKILKEGSAYSLVHVCGVVELPDWILDASWIHWKDPSSYQIVVITAHNVCISYKLVDGVADTDWYQSEVSCILYPLAWPKLHV